MGEIDQWVVSVKVPSMVEIDLFENYLYSIGLWTEKIIQRNKRTKNVNINVQSMRFPNL